MLISDHLWAHIVIVSWSVLVSIINDKKTMQPFKKKNTIKLFVMLNVESLFSAFFNSGLFSYCDSKLAKLMMFILVLDF